MDEIKTDGLLIALQAKGKTNGNQPEQQSLRTGPGNSTSASYEDSKKEYVWEWLFCFELHFIVPTSSTCSRHQFRIFDTQPRLYSLERFDSNISDFAI